MFIYISMGECNTIPKAYTKYCTHPTIYISMLHLDLLPSPRSSVSSVKVLRVEVADSNIRLGRYSFLVIATVRLFPFFTVATGCPSERRPQKTVRPSCYGGIVQVYRTKLLRTPPGSLTCSVYSTVTRILGLKSHPRDN